MQKNGLFISLVLLCVLAAALIGCSTGDLANILGGGGGNLTTARLLVTDYGNSRSLIWNLPLTNNAPAAVVLGEPDMTSSAGGTTASLMDSPNDGTIDPSGNIWIADYGNNRVLEFKPPFSNGMAASVVLGQPDFTSSGCATSATTMCNPANVAADAAGNIFVLDWENNRVLEFKPPFSNGMAASVVIGQVDMNSSNCSTTANGLCDPWQGLAMDKNGNLWVGDRGHHRALRYSPPFTTNMNATVVMGQPDFTSSASGTSATLNNGLSGVAVDPVTGNLFAVDASDNRVLMFPAPFTNGEAATVVFGQPDFVSSGSGTSATTMSSVYDVSLDSNGNLYVAESGNSRVTMFAPPFSSGMAATKVICQPDLNTSSTGTSSTVCSGIEGVTAIK